MKKIVYCAAIICLLAALVSCKSTKKSKNKTADEQTPAATEEVTAEEVEESKESNEKAAEETALSKEEDTEAKDFTGWIKSQKKNINERFGKIQLKIKSKVGSYTISVLNEKDKPIPVLSAANEYITNAVFLKTSKKSYNLVTDNNVRSSARRTADGAVINYEIPSVAQVSLYFSCLSSQKKKDSDMVKVTATVKNISNRNDDFSIKAILDTVLGEAAAFHFYTWEDVPVKNEVLYRTLQNQKWFVSKNMNAAMQLFFTGADCTTPDLVALSNYSTLEKNSWEPDMLNYRVFDTVLSYNNSAVCAIWKPLKLAPGESGKIVYYMAFSGDGTPATGEKYVYSKEFEDKSAEESENDKKNSVTPLEVITPYSVEEASETITPGGVTEITEDTDRPADFSTAANPAAPSEIPNVDFYIKNMSKEQLTPEYIQSLLDRIAALEEDSSSLNRQELLQLNSELDAILTYLRQ